MMKTFLLTTAIVCAIACTIFANETPDEDSVYSALAEVQTVDSVTAGTPRDGQANRLERRTEKGSRSYQNRRRTGWLYAGIVPSAYDGLSTFTTPTPTVEEPILETSDEFTENKPRRFRSQKYQYEIPEVGEDELPFIDAEGDTNRNYGILISASWCGPCKKMHKVVAKLREDGYRIYILDVDAFPKVKEKLNRLSKNKKAPKIGDGVPWFIVRDKGQTVKMFQGYTDAEKIRPHLVPYKEQLEREKDKEGEIDYDFTSEITNETDERTRQPSAASERSEERLRASEGDQQDSGQ